MRLSIRSILRIGILAIATNIVLVAQTPQEQGDAHSSRSAGQYLVRGMVSRQVWTPFSHRRNAAEGSTSLITRT
jgi:hypothetical protein